MARHRILTVAVVALGALALAGCVVSPPPLTPQSPPTDPAPTQPTTAPSSSEPAPSPATSQPASPDPATDGTSLTMDGVSVPDDLLAAVDCTFLGSGALITTGEESDDIVLGFFTDEAAGWTASGFLVAAGTRQFSQRDETAPATYAGGVLTASIPMTDVALGGEATFDIAIPCGP